MDNCTDDFRSLIARIQLMNDYEKSSKRPSSIAWEVRKTTATRNFEHQQNEHDFADREDNDLSGNHEDSEEELERKNNVGGGHDDDDHDEEEESSADTGFKEFIPYFSTKNPNEHVVPFGNLEEEITNGVYNDRFTDDDEDDLDDFDYEEYLAKTNIKL